MTVSRSSIGVGHNSIGVTDSPDRLLAPTLKTGEVSISQKTQGYSKIKSTPSFSGAKLLLILTVITILGGAVLGLRYKENASRHHR